MFRLAKRASIAVSPIRRIFQQLPTIKEKRQIDGLSPLIDLSVGQPHLEANPDVMKSLEKVQVCQIAQSYSPAQGEPETLKSIVKLYKHYYPHVQYKVEETMTTMGGSGALSNIFSVLVEKAEDIILTFEPYFAAYVGQVEAWSGTLIKIPTLKSNFRPTAEGLNEALKTYPNTKALILNYPNNPSGVSLTKQEACQLAKTLARYPHVFIIIDDVYRDFNFTDHVTILDVAPYLKDRCIVINSGAKGLLGAPSERVGMIAAHEQLIKSMQPQQGNSISGVPHRTQLALRYAVDSHLNDPTNKWLINARKEYKKNINAAYLAFKKLGFILSQKPDGTFYLLVNAKHLIGKRNPHTLMEIKDDIDIVNYFLHSAGVATVPGSGFGIDPTEGYFRISCAKEENLLLEAINRMGEAARLLLKPELNMQKPTSNLVQFSLLSQTRNSQKLIASNNDLLIKRGDSKLLISK
jgi:aspartate/methionine/tyrosine aminotransferase